MATAVAGTGSVTSTSSKTYISGTNINTSALVEAAYNARLAESTKIEDRIEKNNKKIDALTKLQTLSSNLQTSLGKLRQSYSVLDAGSVFNQKSGTLTTASTVNASNVASVAIDTDAEKGNHTIESIRLAQVQKVRSDTAYIDKNMDLGMTGTFSLGLEGGSSANINITADMSATDIANAINAQSATTNVKASIVQISEGQFSLLLTGTQNNKNIQASSVSGTDILQTLGITTSGGTFKNEIQVAQSAQAKVDGVTYERNSNNFDDVITGVKVNLLTATPGATLNLSVTDDTSQVEEKITDFINAYNELRSFILTNQSVGTGGAVGEDAALFGDLQLRTLSNSVQGLISNSVGTGSLKTLRDLGITQDADGKLVADTAKLQDSILNNYDDVRAIFETSTSSPIDTFKLMKNTSGVTSASIDFAITYENGAITGVTANGDANLFEVSGNSIVGKAGTMYEGLSFAYVGTQSENFTFTMTQGIADLMDNAIDKFADNVTGSLESELDGLRSLNTDYSARSDRIKERAEDYRDRLIEKYAAMEAKVNAAQGVIAQLKAILGTDDK